jgi:hypothetical protein
MNILEKIDAVLESDETWVWEGKKSALKQPGNKCPKCGAKPPTVHPKKVNEDMHKNKWVASYKGKRYSIVALSKELAKKEAIKMLKISDSEVKNLIISPMESE